MKVLLVNGSPHAEGCTFTVLNEAASSLSKEGIETEIFQVGKKPIIGCLACLKCTDSDAVFLTTGLTSLYR